MDVADKTKINDATADKDINQIVFKSTLAPHFGGVHKIKKLMIKAAKRVINAFLGNFGLIDEELIIAIIGAESLINSRQLTYQTAYPDGDVPITPNCFLYERIGINFATDSVDKGEYHPKKRCQRIQEIVCHFWKRWMKEWFPFKASRKKWQRQYKYMKENDVVLIAVPDKPREKWPRGRVLEIICEASKWTGRSTESSSSKYKAKETYYEIVRTEIQLNKHCFKPH